MQFTKRLMPTVALFTLSIGGAIALQASKGIALSIPPQAIAQTAPQPASRPNPFTNPFESKILEQLNLTPDQQQKIQTINEKYGTEFQQLMQSAMPNSKAFQQAMDGDASDDQLRQLYRQQIQQSQQFANLMFEHQLAVRNVLTLDQRKARSAILRDPNKMRAIFQQLRPAQPAPTK